MCYAIPGRIISIKGRVATIDYFGEKRTASVIGDLKARAGDYVYAQGGIIIDKINQDEALAILGTWKERFFELKKKDMDTLTRGRAEGEIASVLEKAENGGFLSRSEMETILKTQDSGLETLFGTANHIRSSELGNSCCVHGILEFSNYCKNECAYCGINKNNTKIKRYRMTIDEIVERVGYAVEELGFKALVLQSGEDDYYTDDMLIELVKRIRERYGVLLFLSIGERSFDSYKRLYEAGAYGALLRFETSNPKLYTLMRPGKKLDDRIGLIKKLIAHGFVVATGFIIGLPGTTEADLINDILLTKSLKPDMYSFGPLIPHPDTQIGKMKTKPVSLNLALKTIALSRFVDPKAKILVTTALETLEKQGKRKGLLAGGNSLMINLTPEQYKGKYDIYPGKTQDQLFDESNNGPLVASADQLDIKTQDTIRETLDLLYSLGRAPTDLGR